jgi:hypothetical protein
MEKRSAKKPWHEGDALNHTVAFTAIVTLVISSIHFAEAQSTQPAIRSESPVPTALVSSPKIRVKANPSIINSVLVMPNRITVYVRKNLRSTRVELWTGPTGTDVAHAFFRVASQKNGIRVGKYTSYTFALSSCKQFSGVFEPRVFVTDRANPYSVYKGPLECRDDTVPAANQK